MQWVPHLAPAQGVLKVNGMPGTGKSHVAKAVAYQASAQQVRPGTTEIIRQGAAAALSARA